MTSHQLLIARLAKQLYDSMTEDIIKLNERHTFIICRNANYYEQNCFHKLTESQKEKNKNRIEICRIILDSIDEKLNALYIKRNEQVEIHNKQRLLLEANGIKIPSIGMSASGGNSPDPINDPKRNKEFEKLLDKMMKSYIKEDDDIEDYGELNKAFII